MSFDYSNLAAITYTKRHRIFAFYSTKPKRDGSHYTWFYADDQQEYAGTVLRRFEARIVPRFIGDQMKLL